MKTYWISFCKSMIPPVMDGTKTLTSRVINGPGNERHIDRLLGDWPLSSPPHQWDGRELVFDGVPWRWQGKKPIKIGDWYWEVQTDVDDSATYPIQCPYGQPGDILGIKERYQITGVTGNENGIIGRYLADDMPFQVNLSDAEAVRFKMRKYPTRATSGRFMYASLCRTTLVNRSVTVARVQDITPLDCEAEGITGKTLPTPCVGGIWLPYEEYRNGDGLVYGTPRDAFAALWDSINAKRGFPFSENPWVWKVGFEVKE